MTRLNLPGFANKDWQRHKMKNTVTMALGLGLAGLVGGVDAAAALPAEDLAQGPLVARMEAAPNSATVEGLISRRQEAGIATSTLETHRLAAGGRLVPPEGPGVAPDNIGARVAELAAANAKMIGSGLRSPEALILADDAAAPQSRLSVDPHPAAAKTAQQGPYPTTAVPIPNAAWLLGSALVAFVTWSRRRTS